MGALTDGLERIALISGGTRNHIDLGSMFGNPCEQIKVDFLVAENTSGQQGVFRVDSKPEPLEEVVSPFRNVQYLVDQTQNQYVPVVLPDEKIGLFDLRAAVDILENFDEIEIVRTMLYEDETFQKTCNEWKPHQARMALCKVKQNGKFGLIGVMSVDTPGYGFNETRFRTKAKSQLMKDIVYDSISFNLEKKLLIMERDGQTTTEPLS